MAAHRHQPVAVLGLGEMGEAIAERLLDARYPLSVYNRTEGRASCAGRAGSHALPLASRRFRTR